MSNTVRDNITYNTIVVQTDETSVNVSQPITNVVQITTAGPRGPQGLQGPSGSATGVGVEVFNAYTASVNNTFGTKANINTSNGFTGIQTFNSGITVFNDAQVDILTGITTDVVTISTRAQGTLVSYNPSLYRAVILEVHAQNMSSSDIYALTTVYILLKSGTPNSYVISKTEILQNDANSDIYNNINYSIQEQNPALANVVITNDLDADYSFRYLARGIPY
jgi:hypothetical protein